MPEQSMAKPATVRQGRLKKKALLSQEVDWWNVDDDTPDGINTANAVFMRHTDLRNQQSREMTDLALSVYDYHGASARTLLGVLGLPRLASASGWAAASGPVHNITAQAIDTVAALLSLNKPKATFLTTGGDWGQRERACALTDFCEGLFLQNNVYQLGPDLAVDAMVFGDGIAKVYVEQGERPRVRFGRVMRPNLTIDLAEGVDRNPRQMYERRFTTREQLAGLFDSKKALGIIEDTPIATADPLFFPRIDRKATQNVEVIETWKLPDSPRKAGKHVIAVRNGILFEEKWTDSDFPFVFLKWKKARLGFWGISMAQELRALQDCTNKLDEYILETIRRVSRGRVWVPAGSMVSISQLGNKTGAVLQYSGIRPPIIDNSNAVPPEMFEERGEKLQAWAPVVGVGPDAAQGSMPARYKSGEAQREHMQFQDKRLNVIEDNYAYDLFMGLARKGIQEVKRVVAQGEKYSVKLARNGVLERIDFKKDWDPDDEAVELQIAPTNFLADSPEDRKDDIVDLGQAGILDKAQMVDGLDYPDLRALTDPLTAGIRNMRWVVRELQRGRDVDVTVITDLEHGIPMVKAAYLDMLPSNPPEAVKDAMIQWLNRADQENKARQVAAQAATQPQGGQQPIGTPPTPPVAQLAQYATTAPQAA